ncbi:CbtA family protein [Gordonia liuliyuniae]|uniref:CbtA family protein n=1 Tax=Gordonia liuliyuniae TaxID=2911517 RepID=A0ABS9IXL3_9ACTN|nr:CbtA family protein [Gordonia liuliyuniae]MCF8590317.1 CbtA family protein [Gordonia liuliyuniae]
MERKFIGAGLLSGLVAGLIAYAYARIFIEPQVAKAIDYEGVRSDAEAMLSGEHEHEHELFTRSVQENIGAGIGTVVFALAIGALFAVAFTVAWAYVGRRRPSTDPRALAAALAGVAFVAVIAVPFFVYPPNPPAVGEEDTIGSRSSSYLTITIVSIVLAIVGVLVATSLSSRIGAWWSSIVGAVVYLVGVSITASLLPEFSEVPGPVMDGDRIVAPGFPGQVVADFRVYAIANQVLLWVVLTTVFIGLLGLMMRRTRSTVAAAERVSA